MMNFVDLVSVITGGYGIHVLIMSTKQANFK